MTAILGYGDGTTAWLGTDGRNTLGHQAIADLGKRPIIKTLTSGNPLGLVTAGWAVSAQLIRLWEPPDVVGEPPDVLSDLAEHLGRWCMDDERVWRRLVDPDDPGSSGGHIIMAYRGLIADLDGRFNACITDANIACGGCSGAEALAVFLALFEQTGMDPASAMRAGLEYAARIDVHVGPPYSVVEVAASRPPLGTPGDSAE